MAMVWLSLRITGLYLPRLVSLQVGPVIKTALLSGKTIAPDGTDGWLLVRAFKGRATGAFIVITHGFGLSRMKHPRPEPVWFLLLTGPWQNSVEKWLLGD